LTLLGGIPTRAAVGTSLFIISLNAAAGLAGHVDNVTASGPVLLALALSCAAGSVLGGFFTEKIPQKILRRGFAVIVVAIAVTGFLGPLTMKF
jgi:uncharacterized membrane protein YfcA